MITTDTFHNSYSFFLFWELVCPFLWIIYDPLSGESKVAMISNVKGCLICPFLVEMGGLGLVWFGMWPSRMMTFAGLGSWR